MVEITDKRVGFALCGSFCTFSSAFEQIKRLAEIAEVTPIMSFNAAGLDTRFGSAAAHRRTLTELCGREIIDTIQAAEPIGPKGLFDLLIVAPCTGNTLAKLSCGITDTPVTMAVKSHLRRGRPVLLAAATNDALSASAANIGELMNTKHIYFVPMGQDDCREKPTSVVANFSMLIPAAEAALNSRQLQPLLTVGY